MLAEPASGSLCDRCCTPRIPLAHQYTANRKHARDNLLLITTHNTNTGVCVAKQEWGGRGMKSKERENTKICLHFLQLTWVLVHANHTTMTANESWVFTGALQSSFQDVLIVLNPVICHSFPSEPIIRLHLGAFSLTAVQEVFRLQLAFRMQPLHLFSVVFQKKIHCMLQHLAYLLVLRAWQL